MHCIWIDINEKHLDQALDLKVIDKKGELKDISKADLVVLSIPVDASVAIVEEVLDNISDDCFSY